MADDKILADGLYFKAKHEKAPDFVLGGISVKVEDFIPFIKKHSDNGWVNLQALMSKGGKPYVVLDTWKPDKKEESNTSHNIDKLPYNNENDGTNELPF